MNKVFLSIFLIISFGIISCGDNKDTPKTKTDSTGNNTEQTSPGDTKPVFTDKKVLKSYENCNTDSANCSYIEINYVEVSGPPTSELINKYINSFLLTTMYPMDSAVYMSMDAMADGFLKDYENAKKEFPDMPGNWYLNASLNDTAGTDKVISLVQNFDMFTGGAHPVYYEYYYNFDTETGDTLSLNDIFKPGFEAELKKLVVDKFRKDQNLGPNDPLTKGGLFEDTLSFNYNYLLTKDGINFHYNIYEVWSYAQGPLNIFIPYSDLKALLKPEGIY
jgi:hypothetical protein